MAQNQANESINNRNQMVNSLQIEDHSQGFNHFEHRIANRPRMDSDKNITLDDSDHQN